jgi:hypothetical protein
MSANFNLQAQELMQEHFGNIEALVPGVCGHQQSQHDFTQAAKQCQYT